MRVLHVGMPKTGSTALQEALAKSGLLANSDGFRKNRTWGALAAGYEMERARHVPVPPVVMPLPEAPVLSDEDLCLADFTDASSVTTMFAPHFILVVNRAIADLAESWWAEQVKHGETRPLDVWMERVVFADPRDSVESRRVRTDFACHVWTPDVVYEYDMDLLPWFSLKFLRSQRLPSVKANLSLTPEATEALRRWQAVMDAPHADVQEKVSILLQRQDGPASRLLSAETRAELMRTDAEIRHAIRDSGIAQLKPVKITLRPLNMALVDELMWLLGGN